MDTASIGSTSITYTYDGNGVLVKKVQTGGSAGTNLYIGGHYAVINGTARSTYMFGGKAVAVKNGSTLSYLYSDHLGSSSMSTNASGTVTSQKRYYPYGEVRWSSGTLPTDYTFTAQREEASLNGLMDYRARYYDVLIGRFVQADTIVPDPGNSQAYNRYMFVLGSPLKYTDPSGHSVVLVVGLVIIAVAMTASTTTPIAHPPSAIQPTNIRNDHVENGVGSTDCAFDLPGCFSPSAVSLKNMENYGPVSQDEFAALADEVAQDLYTHNVTSPGLITGRGGYDTPLYNGGGRGTSSNSRDERYGQGVYPSDQQVCIEGLRCSGRSEINYFAQGMWGAASGESITGSRTIAQAWKLSSYVEFMPEDAIYWLEWGYDYYLEWLMREHGDDWEAYKYAKITQDNSHYKELE